VLKKWSKTNLQNINIKTRVLFTKFSKHHPKSAIERFNLPRENGGRGFSNLEILLKNQIASLKNYFLNRARDNTFFNALVSADKGYTLGLLFSGLCRGRLDCWVADVSIAMLLSSSELVNKLFILFHNTKLEKQNSTKITRIS
jgi:hypothetical protein